MMICVRPAGKLVESPGMPRGSFARQYEGKVS